MRITSTSRPLGHRLLAATAGLGLALALTACTVGENDDDVTVTESQTSATESAAPAETEAPAPTTGIEALVLNSDDAPELGLQAVPAEEIAGGLDAFGSLADGLKIEPEKCAEFNQDAMTKQAEPGTMALQAGMAGETAYGVAVTTVTDDLSDRGAQVEGCETMSVTIPIEGQELVTNTANTVLDIPAPAGTKNFVAISQDSSMDMMGQAVNTGTLILTGTARGIGISVTATSPTGPITPEVQATAVDAFAKQAAKINAAA